MSQLAASKRRTPQRWMFAYLAVFHATLLVLLKQAHLLHQAVPLKTVVWTKQTLEATIDYKDNIPTLNLSENVTTFNSPQQQDMVPTNAEVVSKPVLLEPMQVLQQYKKWHSVDTLSDDNILNRVFSVAYYSCPLQAGNRLHHFMNAWIWAIVTNRTMLWKYYDKETCRRDQTDEKWNVSQICNAANTVNECNAVLRRADWIASYDEWAPKLAPVHVLDFWSTTPRGLPIWLTRKQPWKPECANRTGVDAADDIPLVKFPMRIDKVGFLSEERHRRYLLRTNSARERARQLYSHGTDFLYGMLFQEAFSFAFNQTVTMDRNAGRSSVFSIAMHSRHKNPNDDGSNVGKEIQCFETVLKHQTVNQSCAAYLMSDRPNTITELSKWLLRQHNCTVYTASSKTPGTSFQGEHGPFAGIGLYQDLALVSQAGHALIGRHSSTSTSLLHEIIEYNRQVQAWKHGVAVEPLHTCLPR